MAYINLEDDVDVSDFFFGCSDSEKKELYEMCCEEFDVPNAFEITIGSNLAIEDHEFARYLNKMASERWKMSKEDEEAVMAIAKKYFFV